jgi:phosphoserine aminotransferase
MARVFNFSAGPSTLPEEVLKKAASEMLDYRGSGMSVMEMSHRSKVFQGIIEEAEALVRELMTVPDDYSVLFLQGGAWTQFAMVPLNLFGRNGKADYVDTGSWSSKTAKEAEKYGTVRVIASSKDRNYTYIPEFPGVNPDADYIHITTNNTIYGTRYTEIPKTGAVPLVADMSSNILSEPVDVNDFGVIYAGAQKNLGPAGVTLVIIKNELSGNHIDSAPTMLRYETHVKAKSMHNTPPCYGIYIVKLVLEWIKDHGGVRGVYEMNREKAAVLYDYLDSSSFYKGTVRKEDRSLMNVPFVLPKDELNERFLESAAEEGLVNLKGHRSVGGMRASIYNAMPEEGVEKLVEFMKRFEKEQ